MGDIPVQDRPERVSNLPNKPPLGEGNTSRSGKGSMQLLELINLFIKLLDKVTSLEDKLASTKAIYNKTLITLTKRVTKLEKQLKHKRRRAVIDSSEDEGPSLDAEDSPKQGRMIEEIDNDETVNLVTSRELGKSHDTTEHRMESEHDDDDDRTLAETLLNIKKSAVKGKAIMQESEPRKKIKKKEMIQISLDEEFAKSLYEEEQAQILIPQKAKQTDEREKVINWNDPDVLSSKKTRGSKKKTLARKRAGEKQSKEGAKRQKTEYEKEKEELKAYLDLVLREEFAIADGGSKNYKIFSKMFNDFDRQDVMDLHRLVEEGYVTSRPEGYDLMLWGDLKILFQPDEEDEVWSEEDDTTTPSPITKSSSPSPPNAPSKTLSTKDTSSTFGTTTSSFESKPQSSPPSSKDTPSPQLSNPFLDDIMDNENSLKPVARTTTNVDGTSTSLIPSPVTADEKTQKKNNVKARSMLLMVLPNEHLLTFNQYKYAKTLFAAIQTRFGDNDATKKTQKTLLKQMYENFNALST
ncbi:hypothetical protein Tco_1491367 [Tanacetum coccineum]